MTFETFGSTKIFRPDGAVERWISQIARKHLRAKYTIGEYRGKKANEVIQHQCVLYNKLLERCIPALSKCGAMDFLLSQYDDASGLLHGNGIYDLREREAWSRVEPYFKRAIKYLVECICLNSERSFGRVSEQDSLWALNVGVSCAETLAFLSQESDLAFSIFKDDFVAQITDQGEVELLLGTQGNASGWSEVFRNRVRRDRGYRRESIEWPHFDIHTETHQQYLDSPFRTAFGISYGEFITVLMKTIDGCQQSLHPQSFPTLFVNREGLLQEVCRVADCDRKTAALVLDGFTIAPSNMKAEGRAIFKPKQTHRACRRGFFLMPHESGPHLAFSRMMARECLLNLCHGVCYRKLPPEWQATETQRALVELSGAAGRWFEGQLSSVMHRHGISGSRVKAGTGIQGSTIVVPADIGEIDFLGFDERQGVIVVLEAKMVWTGLDPVFWRDEIHEFVEGRRSYAHQLRRKMEWARQCSNELGQLFGSEKVEKVAGAIVTLYPTIASHFIKDFPCVSITELALDLGVSRQWPYSSQG